MATKKEMVKEILDIKAIDTESNLMAKKNSELEEILTSLKPSSVEQDSTQVTQQIDIKAMMEEMKSQMLAELKEQARKEVEAETKSTPIEDSKPTKFTKPKAKVEIDRFEQIPVMSVCTHELIYISKKTGAEWAWGAYGDVEHIEFQELLSMRSGQKRFLDEPFIIILDEDAINYLGMTKFYENMVNVEAIDDIFSLNQKEFQEIVEKSPKGIQFSIVTRAREKYEDGSLDSRKKVNYLNTKFKTDIGERG